MKDASTEDARPTLPVIRIALVAIAAILAAVLVLQNTETVETRVLFTTIAMPRAVLLFTTLFLGVLIGLALAFLLKRHAK